MIRQERTKKGSLPRSLIKQLTAYSAAAGAVLAMNPQADSAIHVFHPAEPLKVDSLNSVNLDMDSDGTADFSFGANVGALSIARKDTANRFDGSVFSAYYARNISKGQIVDPSLDVNRAALMSASCYARETRCWTTDYGQFTCGYMTYCYWGSYGQFNASDGYIGVRFRGYDGRDYDGWIHFIGGHNPKNLSGTIDGWAYEDSGGPVKAGDEVNTSIALTYLSDLNANKRKEIAVLQEAKSGNEVSSSIQIKDVLTRQTINVFPCLGPSFTPMSLDNIKDSTGKTTKIAVLGVRGDSSENRVVRVQVIESATGISLKDIFFDKQYIPRDFVVLKDMSGNGFSEIAVLGENTATGLARIEIKDSVSGGWRRTIVVGRSKDLSSVSLCPLSDQNNNGVSEIAVLQANTVTKVNNVVIVDGQTAKKLKTIRCLWGYTPSAIRWTSDLNKDSVPEISVLGVHPVTKAVRVEALDPVTKAIVKTVYFNKTYSPMDLATGDMDNDSLSELSLLGVDQVTGKSQIQIKDALTGKGIKVITLP
jgi:hypothetical protein